MISTSTHAVFPMSGKAKLLTSGNTSGSNWAAKDERGEWLVVSGEEIPAWDKDRKAKHRWPPLCTHHSLLIATLADRPCQELDVFALRARSALHQVHLHLHGFHALGIAQTIELIGTSDQFVIALHHEG